MDHNHVEATLQLLENGNASMNAHLNLLRATHWGQYSVGPMSSWPREMSTILYLLMVAPGPQTLVVGDENVLLYNQAYGKTVRDLHPRIFGQPLDSIPEWQSYRAQMAAHRRGAASSVPTQAYPSFVIPMLNQGRMENVHLKLNIAALPPPLTGFHLCFEETTDCDLRERRRSTVRELSTVWSSASDLPSLWHLVLQSLSKHPEDFPIAAIYSTRVSPASCCHQDGGFEKRTYHIEGSVGDFDEGTLPSTFEMATTDPSLEPLTQAVLSKDKVIINRLPEKWAKGALQRGTGDMCTEAAVLPSSLSRIQDVEALLVIGLPTRALLDEPHHQHLAQLQSEFAHVVNTLMAAIESSYRRKESARQNQLEKDLLAKELALRQQEAEMATTLAVKVLTVIDEVDIGFFEYKSTGELVRANECYYRLSGYPRDCPSDFQHKFLDLIHPADVDMVSAAWLTMINGHWQKFEIRYRNGTEQGQWALVACQPVKDANGNVTSVIGAVTDISTQKRSEKIALDRAEALEQARVSEERFKRCMDVGT